MKACGSSVLPRQPPPGGCKFGCLFGGTSHRGGEEGGHGGEGGLGGEGGGGEGGGLEGGGGEGGGEVGGGDTKHSEQPLHSTKALHFSCHVFALVAQ